MPDPTFQPVERIYRDDAGIMQAQIHNRWLAFTDDELFGIYSIVSGSLTREGPDDKRPLIVMRDQCVEELERRRIADGR